jgi:hypothetical protein
MEPAAPAAPLRFKQSIIRLHPGERRGISLIIDPNRVAPGTPVRVAVDPGLGVNLWTDAGHTAELVVLVVRHRTAGWVREIARKDEDSDIEAHFDPESGVVTVYEGRREFKALERAARRAGLSKARVREYLPYRMLEVEVAANTVYAWAAEEILARRLAEERPIDPAEYASAVHREAQALRYRAHDKLMRAFLDDEVFEGRIRIEPESARKSAQDSLLD